MINQVGSKPTPEQLEEMRKAQAQETFIDRNTALPMPQEGNKIPIEGGGYAWVDPKLANKPTPDTPEGRELTMDDMLTDQKTFEYFKKKGAFDSDQPWYEMLYEGGKAMVSDSYDWVSSLGWRTASNLLMFDWFDDHPYAEASKNIKAKARATTLQIMGDIGLNYGQLIKGASRLKDKLLMKEGSYEDNKSSYEFWKGINEIEKRRKTMAAELATNDFLMMGGDPEIRRMIAEGEVKPDFKASMGGSIWADPLNYISIGAGYKALRGGANTAFNGAETGLLKDLQDAYVFHAQLKEVAKVNPSKKVSDTIDMMDGFIGENLDKLNKIAPKRDIALRQLAESLPQGHQLRDQIEEALTGIPLKAKSNITSKLTGSGMIATGKAVEITGSILNLVSRLPQESAINILMKMGVKEQTAMQIAQSSAFQLGMGGTATYGVASMLTDDELLQLSAVTAVVAPQLLRTYGRDFAKMGAELMQPETILPYWKRLASRGAETLTERTIDRSQWFPVRSVAEQITGAGQGKVGQRIASPFTKNPNNKLGIGLKNEPLGSTGSGGLYDLANILDKSKAGRYLELGGRMTDATVKGGAIGGVFGYIAGGGEQDEALYGGIGAGGLLGLTGGGIGGYGRFRGNLSPTELIQARYGNHQYYTKNLLPAMQRENFNALRKDVQIAVASTAMSYPNLQIEYYRGGKDGVGGEQGINKEGVPYIRVNVDSPRAIEPVIKHELSHYIEEIGGTTPFNDMLIGNSILGLKGYFTKLDENGDPIKRRDGSFETTEKFEDLKFDYFSKFDEYEALYLQSVKNAKAQGANDVSARNYAKRKVLQKVNQLKDNRTGAFIADQLTVRELVAEHGVDFFLNDQRRYRDLREGWVGSLMRNIVDMPMVNNRQFLRTTLGKLGATFRADGTLTTPNSLFRQTQRIPIVTELIRKYNRQMEGLSADQMKKKFPVSEAEVIPVDISGADLAKNPELVELIRAGTFLKVDDDGVIRSNKAMSPAEIKKYNKQFADSILEEVNKIDADEGLPEGHIKETKNDKTGEISFTGRFIDERVIDRLEQKGGWNKAQIDLLRSLNRALRYNKNETGGTDWLISYFKATKKGKYVNAKVENQVHIPYGIEITQKGNILIRTISQKQLDRNINKAFRQHKAEVTRLYGADMDKAMDSFHADMHLWSRNHAEGKMGKDGLDPDPQIAEAKANFINSIFGKSSKAHVDANPWLEQIDGGKKSPTPTYRSLRLERIGKINQLTGKIHIDHNKIAKNLMPKPVDLDALLSQNPQMRSTDPNYMPPSDSEARANMQNFLKANGKPYFAEQIGDQFKPKVLFHNGKIGEVITKKDLKFSFDDDNLVQFKNKLGDKPSWVFQRPTESESRFLKDHFGMDSKDAIYTSENVGGRFSSNYKNEKGELRKFLDHDSDPTKELPDDTISVITNISKVWDYNNIEDIERVLKEVQDRFTTTEMFTYGWVNDSAFGGKDGISPDSMRITWLRELPSFDKAVHSTHTLQKQREGMVEFLNEFNLFDKYKIDKSKLLTNDQYFKDVQDGMRYVERMLSTVGEDIAIMRGLKKSDKELGWSDHKYFTERGEWSNEALIPIIESLGYEGMRNIDSDSGGDVPSKSVLIFDSKNIKLVHGKGLKNYGTFDPNNPDIRYIPAYHGSRYNFDKFSTDKIGTGEGAQAFGHGLYFAGSKEVAKFYRDKLSGQERYVFTPEVEQKYLPLIEAEKAKRDVVEKELQILRNKKHDMEYEATKISYDILKLKQESIKAGDENLNKNEILDLFNQKKEVERKYNSFDEEMGPYHLKRYDIEEKIADLIDEMQSKGTLVKNKGKMYEVDLKPKEEEFLLWDKPMSEQSDIVKDVHNQILKGKTETIFTTPMNTFGTSVMNSKKTFGDQQMSNPDDGASFYQLLSKAMNGDASASRALRFEGIKGIKYLNGSSRRKGEGEYNYVIFDDRDVAITKKYMPKFKGASDDVPKIIEDIDIATNIFSKVPMFGHAFDRSWHINTLVKRVIMNADKTGANKRLDKARKHGNKARIAFNEGKLNTADEYFYYMKYPLQDLVASLPDIKSQDIKKGLNSAKSADPFEPIKDNFQGGTKRPLQDILQEMANLHEKFYPESTSTLNEIRAMGEILKDDYGADIKPEFLDELYRKYRNLTKEEHEQFKAEEQKTLKELFNPEFNDVKDLGGGTKFIKPIDPDANLMPKAPDTPEFRGWFKNSELVDENGNPQVFFHGTKKNFTEFKATRYDDGLLFFHSDPDFTEQWIKGSSGHRAPSKQAQERFDKLDSEWRAKWNKKFKEYEERTGKEAWKSEIMDQARADEAKIFAPFRNSHDAKDKVEGNIMPVFLSVQKLFDPRKHLDIALDFYRTDKYRRENVTGENGGRTGGWDMNDPSQVKTLEDYGSKGAYLIFESKGMVDWLASKGFDGMRLSESQSQPDYSTIAIWDNKKVKSAIANKGTFDPNNPDIRFMPAKDGKEIYQMSSDEFKKRGFMRETDDALTADYYETMKEIRGEPPITEILNLVDPVANHRTIVEQALKDGKDVTYDAVAEYPELTIRWMAREQREGREIKFLPSAEMKPVTFSARPEEIVTLDSENIKNFMPAHKNVRLEDYLDYPIFCLPSDRMGVGTMFVGPDGQKIPVDSQGQGGRGFMYLYEDGGWAFSRENPAKSFMTRVREIAGGRDHALVGITIMSDINHLNSVFGQLSLAQAYEAVLRSGHVPKEQMRDYLQDIMGRVANQKYGKDKWNDAGTEIVGKKGEYKLPDDIRKALLSIDSPDAYKQVILDRKINFDLSPQIVSKTQLKGALISPDDQKRFNIDVESVARDTADPELVGQPVGQVVALLKVPVDQTPSKVNFHLSYPWQVKGEAIGFLDQFKALKDLAGDKRIYKPDGSIAFGQRIQTVLPAFDKLNPSLYMPNFKPLLNGKRDNIRADVFSKIQQDKFSPQQFKAKIGEVKGAKEMAEDIGLLEYLESKKSVTKDEIEQYINDHKEDISLEVISGGQQFADAQMEGGLYDNYDTFLHTLPHSDRYRFGDVSGGHWGDDRVLIHLRKTDRMVDDGSETWNPNSFHIEELQSDWHQFARSEGYADPKDIKKALNVLKEKREIDNEIDASIDYIVKKDFMPVIDDFLRESQDDLGKAIDASLIIRYGETGKRMSKDKKDDFWETATTYDLFHVQETEANLREIWGTFKRKIKQRKEELLPKGSELVDRRKLQEFYEMDTELVQAMSHLDDMTNILGNFENIRQDIQNAVRDDKKINSLRVRLSEFDRLARKEELALKEGRYGQSVAPYKNSWHSVAFADAVVEAISAGKKYVTWTTGDRASKFANLDESFDSVEVRYTQKGYLKEDGSNKYAVNALNKNGSTIRKSVSEKQLQELIGKDYAKEAITRLEKSNKPITSNIVELTDINVKHQGRRLIYDKIIPSVAKRMAKILGVRPPIKSKIVTRLTPPNPQVKGSKVGKETQEVWLMELPEAHEKIFDLPLYMPSLMPQQNIPQANTNIMNRLQNNYFNAPRIEVRISRANQAREKELPYSNSGSEQSEAESMYFKN